MLSCQAQQTCVFLVCLRQDAAQVEEALRSMGFTYPAVTSPLPPSQQAKALEDEYQSKLAQAKTAGDEIVKSAVARAQAREDEIIRQANANAAAILEKANADIAQEKKKALNDAKDEISGVAMAIAEKVVERQLNDADQENLIASFIDGLGESL